MLLEVLIAFYFYTLFLFSIVGHCVYYCILLIIKALISRLICYLVYGFRWYSLIFCLVYIGGVYVLFIFVSIFKPNDNSIGYHKINEFSIGLCVVLRLMCVFAFYRLIEVEFSKFLCTVNEGRFYVCLCLTLIFGFLVLSLLSCWRMKFYR